jgi:hypothetical protein
VGIALSLTKATVFSLLPLHMTGRSDQRITEQELPFAVSVSGLLLYDACSEPLMAQTALVRGLQETLRHSAYSAGNR